MVPGPSLPSKSFWSLWDDLKQTPISLVQGSSAWWPIRDVSRKMAFWVPGERGAFSGQVAWGDRLVMADRPVTQAKRPRGQKSDWMVCFSFPDPKPPSTQQLRVTAGSGRCGAQLCLREFLGWLRCAQSAASLLQTETRRFNQLNSSNLP